MTSRSPLPAAGAAFLDERQGERSLRVSWHAEAGLVVLSLWHGRVCTGSFRLAAEEVPALVEVLRAGLGSAESDEPLDRREAG
jgi:hypothetical protein